MAGLICDIVTPDKRLFSDNVYMVIVPGVEGSMGFLQGHVPLVSALADGVLRLQTENGSEAKRFALQGGYVQVTGQKVIILADRAVATEDINTEQVRSTLAELQAKQAGLSPEEAALTTIAADISWCEAQLSAVAA